MFDAVRDRYRAEGGLKSTNKKYEIESPTIAELQRMQRRNSNADAGHKGHRAQRVSVNEYAMSDKIPAVRGRPSFVVTGQALWEQNATILNCQELAQMACYQAEKRGAPCWFMDLDPMDHSLCVIGTPDAIKAIAGKTVRSLKGVSTELDAHAVDVWLNTVCRIRDYPDRAADKLKKWALAGKRVSWVPPGEDDDVWDAPSGNYSACFLDATLERGFD